jgi:hypothetical protein
MRYVAWRRDGVRAPSAWAGRKGTQSQRLRRRYDDAFLPVQVAHDLEDLGHHLWR